MGRNRWLLFPELRRPAILAWGQTVTFVGARRGDRLGAVFVYKASDRLVPNRKRIGGDFSLPIGTRDFRAKSVAAANELGGACWVSESELVFRRCTRASRNGLSRSRGSNSSQGRGELMSSYRSASVLLYKLDAADRSLSPVESCDYAATLIRHSRVPKTVVFRLVPP